jgi:hypothetical protein
MGKRGAYIENVFHGLPSGHTIHCNSGWLSQLVCALEKEGCIERLKQKSANGMFRCQDHRNLKLETLDTPPPAIDTRVSDSTDE